MKVKVTQDCTQRAMITLFLTLDAYRIIIGTFYTLYVPQICPDTHLVPRPDPMTYHPCTLEDNVTDLTLLNKAALGLNAATCFFMVVGFIQEYRREQWMVKHLEVDPHKPDSNLKTEIESYEKLRDSLRAKNHRYKQLFALIGVMSAANIILSGFLVYSYYDGMKTTTTFVTNTILILQRVIKSITTSRTCEKEMKAQSVYLVEPVTFNTIDPDYRKKPEVFEQAQKPCSVMEQSELQMIESPMKKDGTAV
jgi:hypothetical protein